MRLLAGAAGLACAGLGYFWVFIDGRRRAWPDMFSDTLIVHVPKDAAGA
jgi:uncharacterized RDD family membrane protein YckC